MFAISAWAKLLPRNESTASVPAKTLILLRAQLATAGQMRRQHGEPRPNRQALAAACNSRAAKSATQEAYIVVENEPLRVAVQSRAASGKKLAAEKNIRMTPNLSALWKLGIRMLLRERMRGRLAFR